MLMGGYEQRLCQTIVPGFDARELEALVTIYPGFSNFYNRQVKMTAKSY
jgi:hypothetical protein